MFYELLFLLWLIVIAGHLEGLRSLLNLVGFGGVYDRYWGIYTVSFFLPTFFVGYHIGEFPGPWLLNIHGQFLYVLQIKRVVINEVLIDVLWVHSVDARVYLLQNTLIIFFKDLWEVVVNLIVGEIGPSIEISDRYEHVTLVDIRIIHVYLGLDEISLLLMKSYISLDFLGVSGFLLFGGWGLLDRGSISESRESGSDIISWVDGHLPR